MKKVPDGRKILSGQITMQTYNGLENRIQLWDGKFTTGYRIVEFRIIPKVPQNQEEVLSLLSTEPKGGVPSSVNLQNNENLAYSIWGAPNQAYFSTWDWISEGNMVIEDLWISCYTTGDETLLNYYLVLEKYSMSDWEGAGVLVDNLNQGGPN